MSEVYLYWMVAGVMLILASIVWYFVLRIDRKLRDEQRRTRELFNGKPEERDKRLEADRKRGSDHGVQGRVPKRRPDDHDKR